jgi:hypothetical protein
MNDRKTHAPETEKDTGPAIPRTRCGRETVDLAPFGVRPTCLRCKARETT